MFCRTWNQHNFTKLWYVMSLKMFGCFVHSRCGNKLLTPCEVIGILKSGKFLLVEYDILGFRICNLRIWSPALEGIWNVVPRFWNPQCRTVLDGLPCMGWNDVDDTFHILQMPLASRCQKHNAQAYQHLVCEQHMFLRNLCLASVTGQEDKKRKKIKKLLCESAANLADLYAR